MTNKTSPAARLLFIIDNDYGALGLVMHLLYRQPISALATLLLPQQAYDAHKDKLPLASRPYESLHDILNVVDGDDPDVVFLASGYSYAYQGLLTIRELQKLIRQLRGRGCKLATTDPYLGTFRHITDAPVKLGTLQQNLEARLRSFPAVSGLVAKSIQYYKRRKLRRYVSKVADCLQNIAHICPVPVDLLPTGTVKYISFHNPLNIRSPEDLHRISTQVATFPDVDAARPRWLFVLARFDLEFQQTKYGRQCFVDIVVDKLRQTLDNGRHPTLIGPAAFVDEVARHFAGNSGVSLLSVCPFEEFQQRLLDAEIVFYWQIFSTSTFLRLMNGLPVFFFDHGHTARFFKPMHEAGLRCYYIADSPIYLEIEKSLDATQLAEHGPRFRQSAHDYRQRLARTPAPAEMVSAITDAT